MDRELHTAHETRSMSDEALRARVSEREAELRDAGTAPTPHVLGDGVPPPSSTNEAPDYRAVFEAVPGLYLLLSPELTIIGASDAYCQATLTRREEIVGRYLFDAFPDANPENPARTGVANLRASLLTVLHTKRPHEMALQRYDLTHPQGGFEVRYWRPLNSPVLDANGEVRYIIHRVEDATPEQRLQAERSGRMEDRLGFERLLARATDILPVGLAYLDANFVYRWINPALLTTFGLTSEQVLGRTVAAVFPEAWDQVRPMLEEVASSARPFSARAMPLRIRLQGEVHTAFFDFTYQPVVSPAGAIEGILTLAMDVTQRVLESREQKAQIHSLRELEQSKDQFLSILSHELRTPINAVMGFGSILEDGLVGPLSAEQHEYTRKVLVAADALLALVNDLLDMSRVQAGKLTIAAEPAQLGELIQSTFVLLEAQAREKNIALRLAIADALPPVMADEQRIVQVLGNLVGNALKFTQNGGWVEVRAYLDGTFVRCEVEDNGPGIAAKDQDRLFKQFSQVDMSNTRRAGGMGLGLALCKSLVAAHGGQIGVASDAGKGATFWFTVPIARVP